jgi:hypothetical protein
MNGCIYCGLSQKECDCSVTMSKDYKLELEDD